MTRAITYRQWAEEAKIKLEDQHAKEISNLEEVKKQCLIYLDDIIQRFGDKTIEEDMRQAFGIEDGNE